MTQLAILGKKAVLASQLGVIDRGCVYKCIDCEYILELVNPKEAKPFFKHKANSRRLHMQTHGGELCPQMAVLSTATKEERKKYDEESLKSLIKSAEEGTLEPESVMSILTYHYETWSRMQAEMVDVEMARVLLEEGQEELEKGLRELEKGCRELEERNSLWGLPEHMDLVRIRQGLNEQEEELEKGLRELEERIEYQDLPERLDLVLIRQGLNQQEEDNKQEEAKLEKLHKRIKEEKAESEKLVTSATATLATLELNIERTTDQLESAYQDLILKTEQEKIRLGHRNDELLDKIAENEDRLERYNDGTLMQDVEYWEEKGEAARIGSLAQMRHQIVAKEATKAQLLELVRLAEQQGLIVEGRIIEG
jgi:hypothetical protein